MKRGKVRLPRSSLLLSNLFENVVKYFDCFKISIEKWKCLCLQISKQS